LQFSEISGNALDFYFLEEFKEFVKITFLKLSKRNQPLAACLLSQVIETLNLMNFYQNIIQIMMQLPLCTT
jgi:hypothetical protein